MLFLILTLIRFPVTQHQHRHWNMFISACQNTAAHTHTHTKTQWAPTLIQKSLNMHLLLITLEMNPSGRTVTGARCHWQTAVAVTDNMRRLGILHCEPPPPSPLSPSAFLLQILPAPSLSASPRSGSPLLSPSVRWGEKWYQNRNIRHSSDPQKLNYTEGGLQGGEWTTRKDEGDGVFMK